MKRKKYGHRYNLQKKSNKILISALTALLILTVPAVTLFAAEADETATQDAGSSYSETEKQEIISEQGETESQLLLDESISLQSETAEGINSDENSQEGIFGINSTPTTSVQIMYRELIDCTDSNHTRFHTYGSNFTLNGTVTDGYGNAISFTSLTNAYCINHNIHTGWDPYKSFSGSEITDVTSTETQLKKLLYYGYFGPEWSQLKAKIDERCTAYGLSGFDDREYKLICTLLASEANGDHCDLSDWYAYYDSWYSQADGEKFYYVYTDTWNYLSGTLNSNNIPENFRIYKIYCGSGYQDIGFGLMASYGSIQLSKTVTNNTGSLVISKTTTGAESDKSKEFTFTLRVTDGSGRVQSGPFNFSGSKSGQISGNDGTVSLKNNESITVTGISAGFSYSVKEGEDSNYSVSPSSLACTGTIPGVSGTDKNFTFTINFSNSGSYSFSGSKSGTIASGGTIELKGGEYVTINNIPAGVTYNISESPVAGYTASGAQSGTVSADATSYAQFTNTYNPAAQTAAFTNSRNTSTLTVAKKSSARGICDSQLSGNAMYSNDFSGTEFLVEICDKNTGVFSEGTTYTTDSYGRINLEGLYSGDTVRITETKAPKGYELSGTSVQTAVLNSGSNEMTFENSPVFFLDMPKLCKVKYVNGLIVKEPVAGAVFKMEYFDNTERSGSPKRTWYFKTGSDGTCSLDSASLAEGYASDALYVDENGNPCLPLGSIVITEAESPAGYLKYDGRLEGKIIQNSTTKALEFTWISTTSGQVSLEGDCAYVADRELVIAVDKIDSGTEEHLKGAILQLKSGETVLREWQTDGSVYEIKDTLTAGCTYTIHEKTAPESYKLADDIEFRVDENGNITIVSEGIDTYTNSNGYLTIKMKDVKMIALPLTGGDTGLWSFLGGLVILLGSGTGLVFLMFRYKKSKSAVTSWKKNRHRSFAMSLKQALSAVYRKGMEKINPGKALGAILTGILITFLFIVPVYAEGSIEVVQRGSNMTEYRVYCLMTGTYENGNLWNVKLSEKLTLEVLKEAGATDDVLKTGTKTAKWLAKEIEKDKDGEFAEKLAELVTNNNTRTPDFTFKSGDKIEVKDGYYLVVSNDTYPMLFCTGMGTTQSIYEKLIPKDNPGTGDETANSLLIAEIVCGFLLLTLGVCLIVRKSKPM